MKPETLKKIQETTERYQRAAIKSLAKSLHETTNCNGQAYYLDVDDDYTYSTDKTPVAIVFVQGQKAVEELSKIINDMDALIVPNHIDKED